MRLYRHHALPGDNLLPILFYCVRNELLEGRELLVRTLQDLADEIFGPAGIVACDVEQRNNVIEGQRREQVRKCAMLEETGGEARIRTEQQRVFAAYDARATQIIFRRLPLPRFVSNRER
jgi:hypothetical protein